MFVLFWLMDNKYYHVNQWFMLLTQGFRMSNRVSIWRNYKQNFVFGIQWKALLTLKTGTTHILVSENVCTESEIWQFFNIYSVDTFKGIPYFFIYFGVLYFSYTFSNEEIRFVIYKKKLKKGQNLNSNVLWRTYFPLWRTRSIHNSIREKT